MSTGQSRSRLHWRRVDGREHTDWHPLVDLGEPHQRAGIGAEAGLQCAADIFGKPADVADGECADCRAGWQRRLERGGKSCRLGPLVIHANYLINLAAQQPMLRTRSIQAFHEELVRGLALGADFVVVHPGARGESSIEQAIATIIESVKQAARRVPMGKMRILIENTAGMGTAVGARLEEVAALMQGLRGINAGACLDTAHLFAAGYDIKSAEGLEKTLVEIDQTIGLDNVPVIHVNDSKIALGGRVDRHENLGEGKIGEEAFKRILQHPRLAVQRIPGWWGAPFCWRRQLRIREMTGRTWQSCGNWRD